MKRQLGFPVLTTALALALAQPSQADELLTRNLREALALVDVKVLDHFIVAGN